MKTKFLVVPKGEFFHAGANVTQVVDDEALQKMAASFDGSRKLLVDFDHYSDLTQDDVQELSRRGIQLPSDAAGWITELEQREDGLYAEIEYTETGHNAIQNKTYRFVSPVFRVADCEKIGDKRIRPRSLAKVGLTNEPNMAKIPALSNSQNDQVLIFGQMVELKNRDCKPKGASMTKEINKALNLAENADELAAVEAIGALKNRLEDYQQKEREAQADKDIAELADAGHVIENRDELKKQILANRDAVMGAFKMVKVQKPTLPNRSNAKPPVDDAQPNFDEITEQLDSYCNRHPGVTRNQAWDALYNK